MKLLPTASQTVGPYLHIGLMWLTVEQVARDDCPGEHVTFRGRVLDGDRQPVPDALVEIWQANAQGKYAHPEDTSDATKVLGFRGFGRMATDDAGRFQFHTIKPGCVADPNGGLQAPHVLVSVFMRGLLKRLVTRVYFPDDPSNADDRVLRQLPAERRGTIIARSVAGGELEWDVVLQGAGETVFFDC
jgi:protocatechuate 3,4-dioxygenase, alpha subunit